MATMTVRNSVELTQALNSARGGDTIALAQGSYGDIRLSGMTFATPVTLTSANAAAPTKLDKISISNVNGLTLDNLDFHHVTRSGESISAGVVDLKNVQNVTVKNGEISGSVDGNYNNDFLGINIANSSGVKLVNNVVHDTVRGVMTSNTTGIEYKGNLVYDVRTDGMDFTAVQSALIEGNTIHSMHPTAGDHPDALQFWTAGAPRGSSNITIRNNVAMQGDGAQYQGYFFGHEGGPKYSNFTIEGNIYVGTHPHGISVGSMDNSVIRNNTIFKIPGISWVPAINVNSACSNVTVQNNVSTGVNVSSSSSVARNNIIADPSDASDPYYYGKLFTDPFSGGYDAIHDLTPKAGSPLVTGQSVIGALKLDGSSAVGGNTGGGNTGGGSDGGNSGGGSDGGNSGGGSDGGNSGGGSDGGNSGGGSDGGNSGGGSDGGNAGGGTTPPGTKVLTDGNDRFSGTAAAESVDGRAGNDLLMGNAGNDTLNGGAGRDSLDGGAGNDVIRITGRNDAEFDSFHGRDGSDTVLNASGDAVVFDSFSWSCSIETFDGAGRAILGNANNNHLNFTSTVLKNVTLVDGGAGNDILQGGSADEHLVGGDGSDQLKGGLGNDRLDGSAGDDRVYGDAGNDRLWGGAGTDTVVGGDGADQFVFSAGFDLDRVLDFRHGVDKVDLSAFADINTFAQLQQEATIRSAGGTTTLDFGLGDVLVLNGAATVDTSDFLF